MTLRSALLATIALAACRSEDISQSAPPPASSVTSTKLVYETTDAPLPACTVHAVSDAFTPAHATPAGTVRVDGDYTRTLAKIAVTPTNGTAWSGDFSGPRDSVFDVVRAHLCTTASVYVLKPNGNKDPAKGPVVLDAFTMIADEKADVDNLCNAYARATMPETGDASARDHAAMQWVEDVLTTTHWDGWRRSFARLLRDAYADKADTKELFAHHASDLEAAASALGMKCATAILWKKR